jgi:hypothetical protein
MSSKRIKISEFFCTKYQKQTTMKAADRDTTSLKNSIWWEVFKLALVPVMLAFFGAHLNQRITQRDRMQSYLSSTTDIATKPTHLGNLLKLRIAQRCAP